MPPRPPLSARLLAGLSFLLLSGCSTLPRLPPSLPPAVELTQTPFFPQEDFQCGPAALATLLQHHRLEITPQQLVPQVFLPRRAGSLQVELTAAARRYGMLAYPLAPRLGDLLSEVAAGHPVLVLQNLSFDWLPRWHYAVAVGYDLEQRRVILRSGRHKRWISKFSAFRNTWGRAHNWALVIVPPHRIPATANPSTYLQAAYELEQTGRHQAAHQAYRAASERWPQNKTVWLALANQAYGRQQYGAAHAALSQASALAPEDSAVWNNLAYVYLAAGCGEQARRAITHALRLQPHDENLLHTQTEIEARAAGLEHTTCEL